MGDDLGSEDEAWMAGVVADDSDNSDNDDDNDESQQVAASSRKRKLLESVSSSASKKKSTDTTMTATTTKKRQSTDRLILEAGRNIEERSADEQAAFLNMAVKHYSLLASVKLESKFLPRYFCTCPTGSLTERIKESLSMKKLKKWKPLKSPCAVIVCISARRAVEVLKELSSLKIRVAKLFPKSGSLEEQRQQMQSTSFGLAVGTPHRLAALAGCGNEGEASLSFAQTRLVVFDTHLSNKQYSVVSSFVLYSSLFPDNITRDRFGSTEIPCHELTVCLLSFFSIQVSLPDTAPQCATLLREKLLPELQKRSDFRVAFF